MHSVHFSSLCILFFSRPKGFCAPYNGTICRGYIGHRSVFYNTTLPYTPGNDPFSDDPGYRGDPAGHQEAVVASLWVEMIEGLDDFCRGAAEEMLCTYAFPECDKDSWGHPRPKPLCR